MNSRASKNNIGRNKNNIQKKGTNAEGATTFIDRYDRVLFNVASQFKFRNGSYFSDKDKLAQLEKAIDDNIKAGDKEYILALAWFLGSVNGVRLSPTVLLSYLVFKNKITNPNMKDVQFIVNEVFTRPDFIANAASYYKMTTGHSSFADMPLYFKNMLRNKLSTFSSTTLKKRKMKSRDIKLADLIKVLKPRPQNAEMSALYKAIIENNRMASLQVVKDETGKVVKADSAVAVLSSTNVTNENKVDYLIKNINTIAINELIRNLTQYPVTAYQKIEKRLTNALNSSQAFRYVNPFDLLLMSLDRYSMVGNNQLLSIIDRVLMKTICNNISFNVKNPMILVDFSGSMDFARGKNSEKSILYAIKYLSLILPILMKNDVNLKFYNFNVGLSDFTTKFIKLFGDRSLTPNMVAKELINFYRGAVNGGTSLRDCTYTATSRHPECDCLLIFTDEVSWADKYTVDDYKSIIPSHLKYKTFVFNILPTENTMFCKEDEISRISGLDANGLYLMNALLDFDSFKKNLITMYKEEKTNKTSRTK